MGVLLLPFWWWATEPSCWPPARLPLAPIFQEEAEWMPKVSKVVEHKWCGGFHADVEGFPQLDQIDLILAAGVWSFVFPGILTGVLVNLCWTSEILSLSLSGGERCLVGYACVCLGGHFKTMQEWGSECLVPFVFIDALSSFVWPAACPSQVWKKKKQLHRVACSKQHWTLSLFVGTCKLLLDEGAPSLKCLLQD